jgi:hypothetical protein
MAPAQFDRLSRLIEAVVSMKHAAAAIASSDDPFIDLG